MALHWWNTDLLAADLARRAVSERDASRYMLVSAALYTQANYSALWFGGYRSWSFFFEAAMVLLISLVGVHECFKANGGDGGEYFLERFCAIGVPVGVKVALAGLVVGQGFYYGFPYVVNPSTFRDPEFVYRLIGVIIALTFAFIYYWRIAHHLELINQSFSRSRNAP